MKTLLKIFTLFALFTFAFNAYAENKEKAYVVLKKGGKLKNYFNKDEKPCLKELKIEGEINSEDIYFITTLPQLQVLDIVGIELQANDKKAKKNKGRYIKTHNNIRRSKRSYEGYYEYKYSFVDSTLDILHLPYISTLKELHISDNLIFSTDSAMHLNKLSLEYGGKDSDELYAFNSVEDYLKVFPGGDRIFADSIYMEKKEEFEFDRKLISPYKYNNHDRCREEINLIRKSGGTVTSRSCEAMNDICANIQIFKYSERDDYGIHYHDVTKKVLIRWNDNMNLKLLNEVDSVKPDAFIDSKIKTLTIPDEITYLKEKALAGWLSLETIDLNNVRRINSKAFAGCVSLKEIKCNNLLYIDKEAFYKTNISKITLPECFERIHPDAFEGSNIKEVEFKGIYPIYINKEDRDEYCELPKHIDYITPDGVDKIKLYKADGALLDERYYPSFLNKSAQTEFVFNIEEPGTLSEKITDKIKNDARKITVSGTLYENDYAALVGCKHLRYLDLTNCTFKYSPYYIESSYNASIRDDIYAEQQARMILGALDASGALAAMGISSKSEEEKERPLFFEELSDSTRAHIISDYNKKFDFYGKWKYLREIRFPDKLLEAHEIGSVFVEKIKFPSCATYVDCSYYKLVDVELPQNVERIDISGCRSLRNINFPESLKELSAGGVLENIEILDLSKTKIENINLDYTPLLKELHLPETLKEVGHLGLFDKDSMNWGEYQKYNIHCIIYFNSPTPPEGLSRTELKYAKAVYIPKGSKNAYARGELRSINFIEQQ